MKFIRNVVPIAQKRVNRRESDVDDAAISADAVVSANQAIFGNKKRASNALNVPVSET